MLKKPQKSLSLSLSSFFSLALAPSFFRLADLSLAQLQFQFQFPLFFVLMKLNINKLDQAKDKAIKLKITLKMPNPENHQAHQDDDDDLEEGEIREEEPEKESPPPPAADNNNDDVVVVVNGEINPNPNQDQEGVVVVVKEEERKFCPYCDRDFPNGKALGGHLRTHAEAAKPKLKTGGGGGSPNLSPSPSPNGMTGEVIRCNLCDKEFKSRKSLFGHMRSHPDRNWRGMQPPSELNPPDPFQVEKMVTEMELKWDVRGVRGQKGNNSSEGSSSVTSDPDAVDGARILMMLAADGRGGGGGEGDKKLKSVSKSKSKVYDDDELYYLQNLGVLVNSDDDDDEECSTEREEEEEEEDDRIVDKSEERVPIRVQEQDQQSDPKKKGKKRLRDSDYSVDEAGKCKFRCTTCDKVFQSFQALGGHRSSHTQREKNNHQVNHNQNLTLTLDGSVSGSRMTDLGLGMASNGVYGSGENNGGVVIHQGANEVGVVVHKCKICDKIFSSGQALGGHQRCHYVGASTSNSVDPTPSSPDRSGSETGQIGSSSVVLDLDLNVAAVVEEEEEEGGAVVVESTVKQALL